MNRCLVCGAVTELATCTGAGTHDEAPTDPKGTRPMPARLIGISAIARRLGITRQRVHVLADADHFPRPAHELETGRVWRETDVEAWIAANPRYDHSSEAPAA